LIVSRVSRRTIPYTGADDVLSIERITGDEGGAISGKNQTTQADPLQAAL
jgi:hypothetical protein